MRAVYILGFVGLINEDTAERWGACVFADGVVWTESEAEKTE